MYKLKNISVWKVAIIFTCCIWMSGATAWGQINDNGTGREEGSTAVSAYVVSESEEKAEDAPKEEGSSKSDEEKKPKSVKTSDDSNIMRWGILFAGSGVVWIAGKRIYKREKD